MPEPTPESRFDGAHYQATVRYDPTKGRGLRDYLRRSDAIRPYCDACGPESMRRAVFWDHWKARPLCAKCAVAAVSS